MHTSWKSFREVDIFLDRHAVPLFLSLFTVVLFLPNFFEPYWHWDSHEVYLRTPPLILFPIIFLAPLGVWFFLKKRNLSRWKTFLLTLVVSLLCASPLPRLGAPATLTYYKTFGTFIVKYITNTSYRSKFSELMSDNRSAAKVLRTTDETTFFLWGKNPTLLAFARKSPLFEHDSKSPSELLTALEQSSPEYIVVLSDAPELPGLENFLTHNYIPNYHFHHFVLWRKW